MLCLRFRVVQFTKNSPNQHESVQCGWHHKQNWEKSSFPVSLLMLTVHLRILLKQPGLCRPCSLSSGARGPGWLDGTDWRKNNLHWKSRRPFTLYLTWSIYCGACGARPNRGRFAGRRWWSCSPSGCCRTSCWSPPSRCWSSPPCPTCRCRRTRRCPCTACHSAAPVACNHIMVWIWGIFTKIIMTVFVMSVKLMTMPGRVPCSDLSNKLV